MVVFTLAAIAIATGGFYLSFDAVRAAMRPAFGPKAFLVPVIVDSSIFVFSGVDVVLARLRMGHPLVRLVPLGGTGATVWLNFSAGGGGGASVAHVCMPSVFVAFAEVCRHVVRRRAGLAADTPREGIPLSRWLADPVRSLLLWRRMVLWDIRSFDLALDREFRRLEVIAAMRDAHGLLWRWKTNGHTRLGIRLGLLDVPSALGPTQSRSGRLTASPASLTAIDAVAGVECDGRPATEAVAPRNDRAPKGGPATADVTTGGAGRLRGTSSASAGDRREVARWVYRAFRDAHRALPASLFGELTGYSYWQARRLLEVFGREVGRIDVSDRSDATAFVHGVRERMPGRPRRAA